MSPSLRTRCLCWVTCRCSVRLFRSESSATEKKNLMIFVTPTIIDPAGNRAHSEDEMPFAQTGIPLQRPLVPVSVQ